MAYVALEKLLDKSHESIYKLVILASKRALEIAEGQPKLVNANSSTKPSTIALYEIAEGKVQYKKLKAKE
jgi:DNA-directed RNA polymerase omega subunit